ncbi:dynamin family protein [Kitasatospora arboriphila]
MTPTASGAAARDFDALRADTLALFAALGPVAVAARNAAAAERLAAAEGRLRDGTLTVVVCGEFKRGKSTLLNALLEEPDLFPRDTYFATSLVTTAAYGPQERVVVTLDPPDGQGDGGPQQLEITRDRIAEYATESGNPGNLKRVRLISVHLPNPRLATGLVLVDTPGVGAVHREHTAVTTGFLPQADALVFVADATQPLTESELRFLTRAAARPGHWTAPTDCCSRSPRSTPSATGRRSTPTPSPNWPTPPACLPGRCRSSRSPPAPSSTTSPTATRRTWRSATSRPSRSSSGRRWPPAAPRCSSAPRSPNSKPPHGRCSGRSRPSCSRCSTPPAPAWRNSTGTPPNANAASRSSAPPRPGGAANSPRPSRNWAGP